MATPVPLRTGKALLMPLFSVLRGACFSLSLQISHLVVMALELTSSPGDPEHYLMSAFN